MELAIIMAVCCFAAGIWNLVIAIWGSFSKNRIKTIATLVKASHHKNLHTRWGFVPNWCDCVYVYHVGEKCYKIRVGERKNKNKLFKKMEVVYVKRFPRRVGVTQYRSDEAWVLAVGFLLLGGFLLWIVLYV